MAAHLATALTGRPGVTEEPGGLPAAVAELARRLLREALGDDAGRTELQVIGARPDYWVIKASAAGPQRTCVLKLAGPDADQPVDFARTAAVIDLVRRTGTPAPHVVATGGGPTSGDFRWQLLEHLPGTSWRSLAPQLDEDDLDACQRQLAEALLRIQTVRFDAYGELDADARPVPAYGWFDGLCNRATARIADDRHRAAVLELLERERALLDDASPATLCHDDLHHDNVLFAHEGSGWRLTAVLDWDKAWSADRMCDVARMAFWDHMTGPAFWSVYRSAMPAGDRDSRRARIYQLLWCLEYVVDTPRHRADTAHLAARLGVRLD